MLPCRSRQLWMLIRHSHFRGLAKRGMCPLELFGGVKMTQSRYRDAQFSEQRALPARIAFH